MNEFHQRLQEIQDEVEGTQADLANRLRISISSWKNYLTGKRLPGVDLVERICREFQVSPDWLVLGEGFKLFDGGSGHGLTMEQRSNILGTMTGFYSKEAFLATQIIELLDEFSQWNQTEKVTDEFGWGKLTIDEFSEGMKRVEELELGLFAVGALKVVAEYVRTQTKTSKGGKSVLPEQVGRYVEKASKSASETERILKDLKAQLKEEWDGLARRR